MPAVIGAATAESAMVVQNELHAVRGPFDAERLHVMPQRERVVASPRLDKAADERHCVDDDGEDEPRKRNAVAEATDRIGQRNRESAVALAGERRVEATAEEPALRNECRERQQQQYEAERCRAALVELRADDGVEDLGRQHRKVAAEKDRVAEVGNRLDERDQERVGEAGAHQRERDVGENAPAVGAQRLRGFLETRRHAFDHADQHEKCDRREREDLRDENAGKPVDPAPGLPSEQRLDSVVDEPRAAEDQDQAEPDHERRRDDRQDRQHAKCPHASERRAGCDQRKGETEGRASRRAKQRKKHRVPHVAAATAPDDAAHPPELLGKQPAWKRGEREGSVAILHRRDEDSRDRIEREERDDERDADYARRDESVALEAAAAGEPQREEHRERRDRERRAETVSGLTRAQRRQSGRDPLERPTRRAYREALGERIGKARCPDDGEAKRCTARRSRFHKTRGDGEERRDRPQPIAAIRPCVQPRRRVLLVESAGQPRGQPDGMRRCIPRDERKSDDSDSDPEEARAARVARSAPRRCEGHLTDALMSFSQRSSRRLRVSLDPYFAKS